MPPRVHDSLRQRSADYPDSHHKRRDPTNQFRETNVINSTAVVIELRGLSTLFCIPLRSFNPTVLLPDKNNAIETVSEPGHNFSSVRESTGVFR